MFQYTEYIFNFSLNKFFCVDKIVEKFLNSESNCTYVLCNMLW